MNLFTKKKPTHGHREQTYGWGVRESEGRGWLGSLGWTGAHCCLKCMAIKDLLSRTGNSIQYYVAAWMGGGFKVEWIHVYVWLDPFAVHLRLSHCLSAILQCKIKSKKK